MVSDLFRDQNPTNLVSIESTDSNNIDRCFVCFDMSAGSRLCSPCWNKYSAECRDAIDDEVYLPCSDIRHSVNFLDIHGYLSQTDGWPTTERVGNVIKHGPVRRHRDA